MIFYRDNQKGNFIEVYAYFLFIKIGYIRVDVITPKAQINSFSVHRCFRKRGIGRTLINRTIPYIKETKVNELYVFPHSYDCVSNKDISTEDLYNCYERLGFKYTNDTPNKLKLEEEMVLKL